jgi:predicted nuclease of predicted toxin-antitoxin system
MFYYTIRSVLTRTVNCIILTLDCGFVDSVVKRGGIRSVLTRTVNCIILTLDCGFVDSVVKHTFYYTI